MSHSKFVMATIHVPVEITVEGHQITHTELYEVEFSAIDRLPTYREPPAFVDVAGLFSKIGEEPGIAFRNTESDDSGSDPEFRVQSTLDPPSLTVSNAELRGPRPYPKSRTFRHNGVTGGNARRYTRKSDSRFIHVPPSILSQL